MALSSIQVSIEFKTIMKGEKGKGESFEDYIKRIRKQSIESKSIDNKNNSIESKSIESNKDFKEDSEVIGYTNSGKEISRVTSHLGTVEEIKSDIEIRKPSYPIPIKDARGDGL